MRPRRRRAARRRRRRCRRSSWRPTGTTRRRPRRGDTRRGGGDELHPGARRDAHQRMADVVPVTEVREPDTGEPAEALADRHRVREGLERVCGVGETVDDRDRRVLGERVDLRLVERADEDRAQEAGEDDRGVARRLAACELQVGGGHIERHPAELGDPDLRADPRPRRRLPKDEADGATGEDAKLAPSSALDLQLVGQVERQRELVRAPVGDPREAAALERLRDARHRVDGTPEQLDRGSLIFYTSRSHMLARRRST